MGHWTLIIGGARSGKSSHALKLARVWFPRHGWAINPKTRVKPSKKTYRRKTAKKAEKSWVDELFD